MTSHAYPVNALAGDYGRAAIGLSLVTLPMATVNLPPTLLTVFGGLALLFGAFGLRTAARHASRIVTDERGVASLGWRKVRVEWATLERVRLAFYSTKRDGSNGWMQLTLSGGGRRVTVDSRIENFETILRAAAAAARARGILVSASTAANFAAFGLELEAG